MQRCEELRHGPRVLQGFRLFSMAKQSDEGRPISELLRVLRRDDDKTSIELLGFIFDSQMKKRERGVIFVD